MADEASVLLDVSDEGLAVVRLNRPAKRNAFDEEMIADLAATFETLSKAHHVRVVVLRGEGETFCAGADIDWMRRQGQLTQEANEDDGLVTARMFKALYDLPQLTIALVQGAAFGGGVGLVAACDVAVATKAAKFRFSEVRLGLIPAMISPYINAAIGPRWAKALYATAESFDAALAEKIGLLQYTVENGAELDQMAERLSAFAFAAAPGAVTDAKSLAKMVAEHGRIDDHLIRETARRIAARRASVEGREGLAAFLEKRKPSWDKS